MIESPLKLHNIGKGMNLIEQYILQWMAALRSVQKGKAPFLHSDMCRFGIKEKANQGE
jgi:hypothetical protein